jgi:hypothetical protein
LRRRLKNWMRKKELRGVEFIQRSLTEEEVHLCEPEQGDIPGEKDEEYERLTASLMNYLKSSDQHEDVLIEASYEVIKSCVLKTDHLCLVVDFAGDG